MRIRVRLTVFLLLAAAAMAGAVLVEAAPLALKGAEAGRIASSSGFTPTPVLFFDGLLLLTLLSFCLALFLSHVRLALVQSVAVLAWGVAMAVGGVIVGFAALAKLMAMLALLFAFPFGTIAYFIEFGCGGGGCFDGALMLALVGLALKIVAVACLIIASLKFATVRGLVILLALSGALSVLLIWALWEGKGLPFILYPLDAALAVVVALVAFFYGIVAALKGLFGLAASIAAQAA